MKLIMTVLAILFHLFCRGLSERMYKPAKIDANVYRHVELTHFACKYRVGEWFADLGAEAKWEI